MKCSKNAYYKNINRAESPIQSILQVEDGGWKRFRKRYMQRGQSKELLAGYETQFYGPFNFSIMYQSSFMEDVICP